MAAAVTQTIRLGTAVALPAEHDPISLAKTIASLDHLSGGRVQLGVGFGWNTDELTDHGVPAGRRRTVLREYLEAMRALWTEEVASYDGEHIRFGGSWAWPKPAQPRVPVIVGAGGTERNFSWIAGSADGWLTTPGEADLAAKAALLARIWRGRGPRRVAAGARAGRQARPGHARALAADRGDRRRLRNAGPLAGGCRRLPRPAGRAGSGSRGAGAR